MILTIPQLKSIYRGALSLRENAEGWLEAYQHTDEQMAYFKGASEFWYDRCMASTSKTLEFTTSATEIAFSYRIVWVGSLDSIEIFIDGKEAKVWELKDFFDGYPWVTPNEGRLSFTMPEGEKRVTVYLPSDSTAWIKDFELNGDFAPAERGEKVLWLGDSITQGFGPLRSAYTYVSIANRTLGYDIINQGIGGYVYDKNVLTDMGYKPDKIIIALGTNQCGDTTNVAVEEYYEALHKLYGDTPVLTLTPIWRGDFENSAAVVERFSEGIKQTCAKYPNITLVDGFELIPHDEKLFLDRLHPNVEGCKIYAANVIEAIKKSGF